MELDISRVVKFYDNDSDIGNNAGYVMIGIGRLCIGDEPPRWSLRSVDMT